jgi:hypothetical protein
MRLCTFLLLSGIFFALYCFSCTGVRTIAYQLPAPVAKKEAPPAKKDASTPNYYFGYSDSNWQNYLPDAAHPEYMPVKYLRVNFHIMDSRDSSHNFRAAEARRFCREMLRVANMQLDTNVRNWRSPEGTPILPKRYRYVIAPQPRPGDDGFYFHYDDAHYTLVYIGEHQNNYNTDVVQKYGIGTDSILNVFIQVHPDDSLRSRTYKATDQGIALGLALKMANLYESKAGPERFVGLLNHEIGHILTLPHAWHDDGCPDTNLHSNRCWTWTEQGYCRDNASNNVMDYNAYKIAYTPCQIGRIQSVLAAEKNPVRKCLLTNFCELNEKHNVLIRDSVHWAGARDLEGHLTIASGGVLRISHRLSMPVGSRITVQPGGRLYLDGAVIHNACNGNWEGIFIERARGSKNAGSVILLKESHIRNVSL